MKSDKLQDAIGGIREEYIEEAHAAAASAVNRRKKAVWTVLPLAACLLIAVGLGVGGKLGKKSEPMEEAHISDSHTTYGNEGNVPKSESSKPNQKEAEEPSCKADESESLALFDLLWADYCVSMDTYMEEASEDYQDPESQLLLNPEDAWRQLAALNVELSDGLPDGSASGVQSTGEMPSWSELKYLRFDDSSAYQPYYVFWLNPEDIAFGSVSPEFVLVPARPTADPAS